MSDRQGNIIESVENLIAHMNKTRRLFVILISAAFVIAPTSAVFAMLFLYTDIPYMAGQEYTFSVDLEDLPRDLYDVPITDGGDYAVEGVFDGEFAGKMLGEYVPEFEPGTGGFYAGEFVGEFDGAPAVMFGEFVGEFDAEFSGLYNETYYGEDAYYEDVYGEDAYYYDAMYYEETYYATYGLYEGRFEGTFTGTFYGAGDADMISQKIDVTGMPGAGVQDHPIEFVSEGEYLDPEYVPRFMVIGDESAPYQQADITLVVVAFIIIVTSMSAVVLYVGLHELLFYSNWNSKFQRYLERKSEIDKELGED